MEEFAFAEVPLLFQLCFVLAGIIEDMLHRGLLCYEYVMCCL